MENIIGKIIEIDKKAIIFKEKKEALLNENDLKLKEIAKQLEKEILAEGRKEGKENYQKYIQEAQAYEQEKRLEAEHVCEKMKETYGKIEKNISENMFVKIFG